MRWQNRQKVSKFGQKDCRYIYKDKKSISSIFSNQRKKKMAKQIERQQKYIESLVQLLSLTKKEKKRLIANKDRNISNIDGKIDRKIANMDRKIKGECNYFL